MKYPLSLILIAYILISPPACNTNSTDELSEGDTEDFYEVFPAYYNNALRNPLKGITTRNIYEHPWATLSHTYIKWNEIENSESDDIEKIRRVTNEMWGDIASRNVKVIPRVYLHWSGDRKYWPEDMTQDDYTSEQFKQRVLRLIERLGILWDQDPRIAFIELGIFGKWGEHHSPSPSQEMQELVGNAAKKAFPNKHVSVRHNWIEFTSGEFGEYWDSWAHYNQMWPHGRKIAEKIVKDSFYLDTYVGGEVAYDWGKSDIQPGPGPTESLSEEKHRNFIINSLRWLHCTQLRWIDDYDLNDPAAQAGAALIQKAMGYRYVLEKVSFTPVILDGRMKVSFEVKNEGSAPFYYDWPVEVSLLDTENRTVRYSQIFDGVNIRDWKPGSGWTEPEWIPGNQSEGGDYYANPNWLDIEPEWSLEPQIYKEEGVFNIDLPSGHYILALAILDPAGNLPSVRFATSNYFRGGRHPVGIVSVGEGNGGPLPENILFDDPEKDESLHYNP